MLPFYLKQPCAICLFDKKKLGRSNCMNFVTIYLKLALIYSKI